MEHQKMFNLLNEASNSNFVTRKWSIVNDQSNASYDVVSEIMYNTEELKSNPRNYNDVYILVRDNVTIAGNIVAQVAFKNCAPFIACITKFDVASIDYAKDLDLVMPVYNLLEYK